MKKITIVLAVLFLIVNYYGCSDDTTSSTSKNVVINYEKMQKNDTLTLIFKYQDTAFTFLDTAALSQFDTIPKVKYEITLTNGYLDFSLFNVLDSNIFRKHFTANEVNTVYLTDVPRRYIFSIVGFTGSGSIKVVK